MIPENSFNSHGTSNPISICLLLRFGEIHDTIEINVITMERQSWITHKKKKGTKKGLIIRVNSYFLSYLHFVSI